MSCFSIWACLAVLCLVVAHQSHHRQKKRSHFKEVQHDADQAGLSTRKPSLSSFIPTSLLPGLGHDNIRSDSTLAALIVDSETEASHGPRERKAHYDEKDEDEDGAGLFCDDSEDECAMWAAHGLCVTRQSFMTDACPYSCNLCRTHPDQPVWQFGLGEDLGVAQKLSFDDEDGDDDYDMAKLALWELAKARRYLEEQSASGLPFRHNPSCRNHDPLCALWAADKECEGDDQECKLELMCATVVLIVFLY